MHLIQTVIAIVLLAKCFTQTIDACTKIGSCSCQNSKGIIDLSPIALNNGDPKFKDVLDDIGVDKYSWNPCFDFSESGECEKVAVCQIQTFEAGTVLHNDFGLQNSATFVTDQDNNVQIEYTADVGLVRTTVIKLTCVQDAEAEFSVSGETTPFSGIVTMELKSKYACPVGSSAFSIGSIMLVTLLGIVVLYVMCGVLFQTFVRKAEGVERLPNYTFWSGLMRHIKFGVLFTVNRGKMDKSYENI